MFMCLGLPMHRWHWRSYVSTPFLLDHGPEHGLKYSLCHQLKLSGKQQVFTQHPCVVWPNSQALSSIHIHIAIEVPLALTWWYDTFHTHTHTLCALSFGCHVCACPGGWGDGGDSRPWVSVRRHRAFLRRPQCWGSRIQPSLNAQRAGPGLCYNATTNNRPRTKGSAFQKPGAP